MALLKAVAIATSLAVVSIGGTGAALTKDKWWPSNTSSPDNTKKDKELVGDGGLKTEDPESTKKSQNLEQEEEIEAK